MHKALAHLRQNVVAYLALFVALGGTGYAAANLPAGSVGASQLRNHSIAPVKFNRQFINGTVRAWAEINANGTVMSSSSKAKVKHGRASTRSGVLPGELEQRGGSVEPQVLLACRYQRVWRPRLSRRRHLSVCPVGVECICAHLWARGQFLAQPFYVAVLC